MVTSMNTRPDRARDAKIVREASALWRELYGDAPPADLDAGSMLDAITRGLPDVGYERLRTPHLRPSNIAFPRGQ